MKAHTSDFKNNLFNLGRQVNVKLTYTSNNEEIILDGEVINSVSLHYNGSILKSVMKQLDIDVNSEIPQDTIVNLKVGIKVGNNYEYLDYGNFIVNKVEKQEDVFSYKITCYDKMILSMVNYEDLEITYPITIRSFINEICIKLGFTFANVNDTFANYDKEIKSELYLDETGSSLGYTYRTVLDELAQVTASTICINDDGELELRYINNTNDVIDEDFLRDDNVNFAKKYGPINSIVFSRSADTDNVFISDDESVELNGLCEIKIKDNQILNSDDRSDFLQDILTQLDGLEYYINDFSSTGVLYYDLCDRYTLQIGNNSYSCIMFNDEIEISQGIVEHIFTDSPEENVTDYKTADKTDMKINQTTLKVDKVNGEITSVVSRVSDIEVKEGNDYQDLVGRFDGYVPTGTYVQLESRVTTVETDTYTKTEINTKLTDGSVTKVRTVSGTFDENGMTYEKSDAETKTVIDAEGISVKKSSNNDTVLFAGYVEEGNTQYSDYKGQTIVATENIMVNNYLVVGSRSRFENYEGGTGCFFIG